ncbi:MAG: NAD(P)-dependent glycerol-3-phosphate dehydrogenase [Firmicutes bacterium]|nr:NAD(P)-dependent glycerol-3-phosphate dehydrogenase [Bacillota bacterium]
MKISVIGIGSWGTALSIHLLKNGHQVTIYGRLEDNIVQINKDKIHPFLPGIVIPDELKITGDLKEACNNEYLILAVPSPYVREVVKKMYRAGFGKKTIINVAKGFEIETGYRLSEVVAEVTKGEYDYCVLSGPTHAEEVAKGLPAAIVVASENIELAKHIQEIFNNETLRVYTNDDTLGVEIGGSFKNVVAIASGIVDGLEFGDNAKASLITRGLHEMKQLGKKLGANVETFNGLTGIGDLMVTCMSKHSRNRGFGEKVGKGLKPSDILNSNEMVTEGVYAAKAFYLMSQRLNIDLPITEEVYKCIYEDKKPIDCFKDLMGREMKMESE